MPIEYGKVLPRVIGDFETRSCANLKDVGAWVYAEHPTTSILCFGYKIGNEPARIWVPGREEFPARLVELFEAGAEFEAHNAGFERAIWTHVLKPQFGINLPRKWLDTMAVCAYRSLPMDLDKAGAVLGLSIVKDKRGKELIRKLTVPQKITMKDKKAGVEYPKWNNDPALMEELYAYCVQDCEAEYALGHAIQDLPGPEYDVWCLDQVINQRGVYVDQAAINGALCIRDAVNQNLTAELRAITNNEVGTADERDKIINWCNGQGVLLPDMTADTVEEYVDRLKPLDDLQHVRRVLQIRQALGKASTKKLDKFLSWRMKDGRLRGLLQYHGAGTGRWAGRGVQPQNFPRGDEDILEPPSLAPRIKNGELCAMPALVDAIRTGDADHLELAYGDPMEAISTALRGFITPAPGMEFYVADFSAIEARVLAWVAGEQWKLDAFAGIDRGEGYNGSQDIYLATASMVYGYPCLTKKTHKAERQTGKTCELAFGYQGGIGAWRKFDSSDKWTDEEVDEKKKAWRASHPMVVKLWYGLEEAAIKAVLTGRPQRYRNITYQVVKSAVGNWLACKLPSGRCLWYYNPRCVEVGEDFRTGAPKFQVEYEGKDNKKGGVWGVIRTYGGMLTENVVQAISRDLMCDAMFRLERAGYPIILTVHDEIIAERPFGTGDMIEFYALMSEISEIYEGLPINVDGWHGTRYQK